MGIYVLVIYYFQFGVGIGMTWEGVFENDFAKIDSSYIIIKDAFTGLVMTISNMALADWIQDAVFGIISDFSDAMNSMYEFLEEKRRKNGNN